MSKNKTPRILSFMEFIKRRSEEQAKSEVPSKRKTFSKALQNIKRER